MGRLGDVNVSNVDKIEEEYHENIMLTDIGKIGRATENSICFKLSRERFLIYY